MRDPLYWPLVVVGAAITVGWSMVGWLKLSRWLAMIGADVREDWFVLGGLVAGLAAVAWWFI